MTLHPSQFLKIPFLEARVERCRPVPASSARREEIGTGPSWPVSPLKGLEAFDAMAAGAAADSSCTAGNGGTGRESKSLAA